MSKAKARSILRGLVSANEQEELILFLEYKVEEKNIDVDALCEQLQEDFALPHAKTRQLICALGGQLNAPRVISKPRAFPGKKRDDHEEDVNSASIFAPRPVRGRGTRGRARGRRGRGRGRRGRGARGLRPVVSFPTTSEPKDDERPTERAEPPSPDTLEEISQPEKEQPKESKKFSAPSRPKVSHQEDTACFICAEESEYWAIANCGHSCCARCAVKYRWTFNWLGKARIKKKPICPWCRQPWKRIFIGKQGLKLEDFDRSLPFDKQLKVTYQTRQERAHFHKLLEMRCPICDEPSGGYNSLDGLQNHMRDQHNSYLCTLCLDNTSMFLDEHEIFESKDALKKHKKKTHPQCPMCNTYFFNQDILDAHKKNEHPTCPGKDCTELVFRNMNEAKGHYRTAHFLCELDGCAHSRQPQLFLDKAEYQRHIFEVHTQCVPAGPVVKKRKAKRRPRTVTGNAVTTRLEKMGHIIQTSLPPELVIYHQLLFSADIGGQLLFKSFRVCWESEVEFNVWEQFWLYYISTLSDPDRQSELYNLYRAYCHDPGFDKNIQRWSPTNQNHVSSSTNQSRPAPKSSSMDPALGFGAARPKPASSRNVTQPASREILYGAWGGRDRRSKPQQPRVIPKPTSRGSQPALKGVWARRSGGSGARPKPFPVEPPSPPKKQKEEEKEEEDSLMGAFFRMTLVLQFSVCSIIYMILSDVDSCNIIRGEIRCELARFKRILQTTHLKW